MLVKLTDSEISIPCEHGFLDLTMFRAFVNIAILHDFDEAAVTQCLFMHLLAEIKQDVGSARR